MIARYFYLYELLSASILLVTGKISIFIFMILGIGDI